MIELNHSQYLYIQPISMLIFQRDCLMNIHLLFHLENLFILERYILKALKYAKNKTTVRFSMTHPYTFEVTITHLDNINFTTIITTQDAKISEEKISYTPVTNPICVTGSKFNYICKAIKYSILLISKLNNSLFI